MSLRFYENQVTGLLGKCSLSVIVQNKIFQLFKTHLKGTMELGNCLLLEYIQGRYFVYMICLAFKQNNYDIYALW